MRRVWAVMVVATMLAMASTPAVSWSRQWRAPRMEPSPHTTADGREVWETHYLPMMAFEGIELRHPAGIIEHVGLHQSNHEGARDLDAVASSVPWSVMESRGRLSGARSAADVVVPPGEPIRAPVTGTVVRAGTYVLYCAYEDGYVVLAPDQRPEWELKVLHVSGLHVGPGDRVQAGRTVLADSATVFPFRSQVDDRTTEPSWPHTHLELIDTSIPNVGNPGSGGC